MSVARLNITIKYTIRNPFLLLSVDEDKVQEEPFIQVLAIQSVTLLSFFHVTKSSINNARERNRTSSITKATDKERQLTAKC